MKLQPKQTELQIQLHKLNEQIAFLVELNKMYGNNHNKLGYVTKLNKIMKIKFEDYQKLTKQISDKLLKMNDKEFIAYSKVLNSHIQNILTKYGELDQEKYEKNILFIKKNIKMNILDIIFNFAKKFQKEELYMRLIKNLKENQIITHQEIKSLVYNRTLNIKKLNIKKILLLQQIFESNLKSLKDKHQNIVKDKIGEISKFIEQIKENQAKIIIVQKLKKENLNYYPEFKNLKKNLKIDENNVRNQIKKILKNKTNQILQELKEQESYSMLGQILNKDKKSDQSSFHTSDKVEKMYKKSQRQLELNLDTQNEKFKTRLKNLRKQFKEDNVFNIEEQKPIKDTKRKISIIRNLKKKLLFESQQKNNQFMNKVNKRVAQRIKSQQLKIGKNNNVSPQRTFQNLLKVEKNAGSQVSDDYSLTRNDSEESKLYRNQKLVKQLKQSSNNVQRTKSYTNLKVKDIHFENSHKQIDRKFTSSEKQVRSMIKNITHDQIELIEQLIGNFDDNEVVQKLLGIFKFSRTLTGQLLQTVDKQRKSVFEKNLLELNQLNSEVQKRHKDCYSFLCKVKDDEHQCPINYNNYHTNQLKQVREQRRIIKKQELENVQQNPQKQRGKSIKSKSIKKINKKITQITQKQVDKLKSSDEQLNYFDMSNSSKNKTQKKPLEKQTNQTTNIYMEKTKNIKNSSSKSSTFNYFDDLDQSKNSNKIHQKSQFSKQNKQESKKSSEINVNYSNHSKKKQSMNQAKKSSIKNSRKSQEDSVEYFGLSQNSIDPNSKDQQAIKQQQKISNIQESKFFKKKSSPSSIILSNINNSDDYLQNIESQLKQDCPKMKNSKDDNKKSDIQQIMENDMINSYRKILKSKTSKKSELEKKIEAEKKRLSSKQNITRAKRMDTQILPVNKEDILSSFENKRMTRLTKISDQDSLMDYLKPSDDDIDASQKLEIQNPFIQNTQTHKLPLNNLEDLPAESKKIDAHFTRTISEPFEFRDSNRYSKTDAMLKISETDSMGNYFDQI